MCRLAAYVGPEISLRRFLFDPSHSLIEQAWAPQELRYAKLNADGFGIGWYAADRTPAIYTNPMPIWGDTNITHLADSLTSAIWLGNVRSATQGIPVNQANTQPFYNDQWMFLHNGFIADFIAERRMLIERELTAQSRAAINGSTDSEYLFALFCQFHEENPQENIATILRRVIHQVGSWMDSDSALLNLVITDGNSIYAARSAINHDCPSLYYSVADELFPEGQLIASERLTADGAWQPVPEHHLIVISPGCAPDLSPL